MTLPVRLLPEAKDEFDQAIAWHSEKSRDLGLDFVVRVREALQRIAANPRHYGKVYQDVRKTMVQRFPYIVLYQEDESEILVVSIFHTSRDPMSWQSRIQ